MQAGRGRRPAGQARPARLRAVEGREAGRAGDAPWPVAVGAGPARAGTSSAPRWRQVPGRRVRHPRRRARPASSRTTRTSWPSRAPPVSRSRGTGCTTAWITTAGEKMSKSLGNSLDLRGAARGVRRSSCATTWSPRTTGRTSTHFEALDEAAAAFRRIESFARARRRAAGAAPSRARLPPDVRRRDGRRPRHLRGRRRRCTTRAPRATAPTPPATTRGCAQPWPVCGRCSTSSGWTRWIRRGAGRGPTSAAGGGGRAGRVGAGAAGGRPRRKDWAAADALRDQLKHAGIVVEDTPQGPRWTWGADDAGQLTPPWAADHSEEGRASAPAASAAPGSKARAAPCRPRNARGTRRTPGRSRCPSAPPGSRRRSGEPRRRPGGRRGPASSPPRYGWRRPAAPPRPRMRRSCSSGVTQCWRRCARTCRRPPSTWPWASIRTTGSPRSPAAPGTAASRCWRSPGPSSTDSPAGCCIRGRAAGPAVRVPPFEDLLAAAEEHPAAAAGGSGRGHRSAQPGGGGALRRRLRSTRVFLPERRAAGMTATAWRTSAGPRRGCRCRGDQLDPGVEALPGGGVRGGRAGRRRRDRLYDLEVAVDSLVVVVGSEGRGLSRLVGDTCDLKVSIPMAAGWSR